MWQFQWVVSLIPDSILSLVYWAIIAIGVTGIIAGWLGRWIPFYGQYAKILKPIGVILLVLGVWLRGGYDVEMAWRDKVADMQKKVDEAQAHAALANRSIENKVETQTKVIKEKGKDIIKYVDRYRDREVLKTVEGPERIKIEKVIEYVEKCPVPGEIIELHNQATELNKAAEIKK